jgi:hypothetical protein
MTPEAKDFLTYDYSETKDLGKAFLTLISAVLVFSITFSDKVVDFPRAGKRARLALFGGWSCFVLAIVVCGIAFCINYQAMFMAVHEGSNGFVIFLPFINAYFPPGGYIYISGWADSVMLLSDGFFVLGLLLLLISSVSSTGARIAGASTTNAVTAEPSAPDNPPRAM